MTTPRISIASPDSSFLQGVLDYAASRQSAGSAEYTIEHMVSRYDMSGSDLEPADPEGGPKPAIAACPMCGRAPTIERMNEHEAFLREMVSDGVLAHSGRLAAAADEIQRLEAEVGRLQAVPDERK